VKLYADRELRSSSKSQSIREIKGDSARMKRSRKLLQTAQRLIKEREGRRKSTEREGNAIVNGTKNGRD